MLDSAQPGSHVPPPLDLSDGIHVCFPLQHGDRFWEGWQQHLFSPPGSWAWRGGKLKPSFTHFLETVKQVGGPAVREKTDTETLSSRYKEYIWMHEFILLHEFDERERKDTGTVKSTCCSQRICWCPQISVYSECSRWPPSEDAGSSANTRTHEHIIRGTYFSRHGYRKSTGTWWNHPQGLISDKTLQT